MNTPAEVKPIAPRFDPGRTMQSTGAPTEPHPTTWGQELARGGREVSTTLATEIAAAIREDSKQGRGMWVAVVAVTALVLAAAALIAQALFWMDHRGGNAEYNDALGDLVDIMSEHADCSAESFAALAEDKAPPRCPSAKRKVERINRTLRR